METVLAILMVIGIFIGVPALIGFAVVGAVLVAAAFLKSLGATSIYM
jgi:hypothetical protein